MNLIMALVFILFFCPVVALSADSDESLILVGKGEVRYLGFIKVYDAELYAVQEATTEKIQHADCSYCLKLKYRVDLGADKFIQAANNVLARQWPDEKISRMRPEIDKLHQAYRDVQKGDLYSLCYDSSNKMISLALNEMLLTSVHGREFAEMYAGIWFGKQNSISSSLQKSLFATLPQR